MEVGVDMGIITFNTLIGYAHFDVLHSQEFQERASIGCGRSIESLVCEEGSLNVVFCSSVNFGIKVHSWSDICRK
jgi:hypothetical protein